MNIIKYKTSNIYITLAPSLTGRINAINHYTYGTYIIFMSCTLPKKKTDRKLNTLKCSYNRLLMTIDRPLLHGGATNECAGTTMCMPPS